MSLKFFTRSDDIDHFFFRRSCQAYIFIATVEIVYALFLLIKSKTLNDECQQKRDPKEIKRALKVAQTRTAQWVNDSSNSTISASTIELTEESITKCQTLIPIPTAEEGKTDSVNVGAPLINDSAADIESLLNPKPKKICIPNNDENPFYKVELVSYDDYINGLMWQIKRLIVNIIQLILTAIFLPGIRKDDSLRTLIFCVGNTGMILLNFILTVILLQYCTVKKNYASGVINSILSLAITLYLTVIGYLFLNHVIQNNSTK